MKLLIISTHPCHTTGYSRVIYNVLVTLLERSDIDVTVFGIQKYFTETEDSRSIPEHPKLNLYNVLDYDTEDHGYGTKSLKQFIEINKPEVVLIYNDAYVSSQYIKIINQSKVNPKIVLWLDQIYDYQYPKFVDIINNNVDHLCTFSDYWTYNAILHKYDEPITAIKHCINPPLCELTPQDAKTTLKIPHRFIFLNLNRNQTRKRPDLTIQGYVLFLKEHHDAKTTLFMGNTTDNTYNLKGIFDHQCMLAGIVPSPEAFIVNETRLTDEQVTLLYNACEVGINTCQGEGYGLCNYEHAWYGKPQIVSNVGGLKDYFNESNSIVLEPKITIYGPSEDKIPDMGKLIDPRDLADGMHKYYTDDKLYEEHSKQRPPAGWGEEVDKLIKVLNDVHMNG